MALVITKELLLEKGLEDIKKIEINTKKEWENICLKQALDFNPIITYIYSMKEVHIKVSNISSKQWANLLIELNLVKTAWKRYGPDIKIKAKNFDRIIRLGGRKNGEDYDKTDPVIRWDPGKRKV